MRPDQPRRPVARLGRELAGIMPMSPDGGDRIPPAPGGWSTPGCEFTREPQSIAMGSTTMPVTPPDLEAVMARIDQAGRTTYTDSYAGLEVDQEDVRAVVYRVPSTEFDNFIRETAGNTCVTVHDAPHSEADLTVWQDRVIADLPELSAAGIFTIGARHDGAGVELGVENTTQAQDQIHARYGPSAPFLFQEQPPVQLLAGPSSEQVSPAHPTDRPQSPTIGS